jgi:hypothetical protein
VIEDQTHRAAADLRRELVARIAHDGSTFSGVGASGKPGAVQNGYLDTIRFALQYQAVERLCHNGRNVCTGSA